MIREVFESKFEQDWLSKKKMALRVKNDPKFQGRRVLAWVLPYVIAKRKHFERDKNKFKVFDILGNK